MWHMMTVNVDAVACTMTLYDGEKLFYKANSTEICQLSLSATVTVELGSAQGTSLSLQVDFKKAVRILPTRR